MALSPSSSSRPSSSRAVPIVARVTDVVHYCRHDPDQIQTRRSHDRRFPFSSPPPPFVRRISRSGKAWCVTGTATSRVDHSLRKAVFMFFQVT